MNKQPELIALTRKKLIDVYFVLMRQGKRNTINAETQSSVYNRCTFYRNFADTEQLFSEVEAEICGELNGAFTQAVLEGASMS